MLMRTKEADLRDSSINVEDVRREAIQEDLDWFTGQVAFYNLHEKDHNFELMQLKYKSIVPDIIKRHLEVP